MIVMIVRLSEPLWPQQRVREVDQQTKAHHSCQRIIEGHDQFSSEPIAGVAVPDRQGDEPEPDDQHDHVHHLNTPDNATDLSASNGTAHSPRLSLKWSETKIPRGADDLTLTAYDFETKPLASL
jgi:hypothetical protein